MKLINQVHYQQLKKKNLQKVKNFNSIIKIIKVKLLQIFV